MMSPLRALFVPALLTLSLSVLAGDMSSTRYGHRAYGEAPPETLVTAGIYRQERAVKLRAPAAKAFQTMVADAGKDKVRLTPISGFRPISYQEGLWKRAIKRYGSEKAAARWVAPPGHSEHATGWTLDIGDLDHPETDVTPAFETTPAYAWLQKQAVTYGFELSFPKNNAQGVSNEPWHWRYVGIPEARRLFHPE